MPLDNKSFISVTPQVIAEFPDTGPEAYDLGTPIGKRTRRSSLFIVFSFSADPGNWEAGLSVSLDGVNYVELESGITGTDATPIAKKYSNVPWNFIQPFQVSKDNDVVMTITAKLV